MLDIKQIRSDPQTVRNGLTARGCAISIDTLLEKDTERRFLMAEADEKKAQQNAVSKKTGMLRKKGASAAEIAAVMEEMRCNSLSIKALDEKINALDAETEALLRTLPNLPCSESAINDEDAAPSFAPRVFEWEPKSHEEITNDIGLAERMKETVERIYLGFGSRLIRSLSNYYLNAFTALEYCEIDSCNDISLHKLHQNRILKQLPIRNCGGFRKMNETVIELLQLLPADEAISSMNELLRELKLLTSKLGISCRLSEIKPEETTSDSAQSVSLEIWFPSLKRYTEAAVISLYGDYITRDLSIRYKTDSGEKPKLAHSIGGYLYIETIADALLENFQNGDGSICVPSALISLMGTDVIR